MAPLPSISQSFALTLRGIFWAQAHSMTMGNGPRDPIFRILPSVLASAHLDTAAWSRARCGGDGL